MAIEPVFLQHELDELIVTHRGEMSQFWGINGQGVRIRPVPAKHGVIRKLGMANGRIAVQSPVRDSLVAKGDQTPKGDLKDSKIPYTTDEYRFAFGIDEVDTLDQDAFRAEVQSIMKDNCGLQVALDIEKGLNIILKGDGDDTTLNTQKVDTRTLLAAERFDNPDSDIIGQIRDEVRNRGVSNLHMDWNIASAMTMHPQLTGAVAGSGVTYLGFEALYSKLRDAGISQIFIDGVQYHEGPREFSYNQQFLHTGVFCLSTPDNIVWNQQKAIAYDEYENPDTMEHYVRAHAVGGWQVQEREGVVAFKSVVGS